ncbi:hypothetical protein DCAR_0209454 [Daucus carota subsp. sativus]|uniref:MADS-box domain-containing protein n=1 Tax=Daucus carota subsp. sativus TaxID=79200 RepID=A0AAF1ARZ9_DAUCS|nr:PREDICTED: agamous-like MADS-box protein AGL31 [Daucus carota subsp. sativus]WOG90211.1 hypothetical protein DCAR_0209454 [Daucus carota subsp. sativus]
MKRSSRRVEFIENKKKCSKSFMKRRSGLVNKARELSILCGVDACMIINAGENKNNDDPGDFMWSSSSDSGATARKLINKYREDEKKVVYSVSNYFVDKTRKAEKDLASLKKKSREDCKLSTWNPKFENMKEHELRDLVNDLEIKIYDLKRQRLMKNKRIKTGTDSIDFPSLEVDHGSWSNGDNNFQPKFTMEPNYICPPTMNSVHCNSSNYDSEAIVRNQMNYCVQPIAMIKPDAMFDHCTSMGLQPQFCDDSRRFGNYNSGAQAEAKAFSYSSLLMNPGMMSSDLPVSLVYDHNAFNF